MFCQDFAGEIFATSKHCREYIKQGDRVVGTASSGGSIAEYIAIRCDHLVKISADVSFADAASMATPFISAYQVFIQYKLTEAQTVVVVGADSAMGTTAVQIARAMGAMVVALCEDEERCSLARELGAHQVFSASAQNLPANIEHLKDVRLIYDTQPTGKLTEVLANTRVPHISIDGSYLERTLQHPNLLRKRKYANGQSNSSYWFKLGEVLESREFKTPILDELELSKTVPFSEKGAQEATQSLAQSGESKIIFVMDGK